MKTNPKSLGQTEDEIKDLQTERSLLKNKLSDPEKTYDNPLAYSSDVKRLKEINKVLNAHYVHSKGL